MSVHIHQFLLWQCECIEKESVLVSVPEFVLTNVNEPLQSLSALAPYMGFYRFYFHKKLICRRILKKYIGLRPIYTKHQ